MADNQTNLLLLDFALFRDMPESYFLLDKVGTIRDFNSTAHSTYNVSGDKEQNFIGILAPESVLSFEHAIIRCTGGEKSIVFQIHMKDRSDRIIDARIKMFLLNNDPEETEARVLLVVEDRTEANMNAMNLTRFKYVAEHVSTPLQITDLAGKMIFINSAFENESGYLKEELLGQNPRIFGSGKHSQKLWDNMWSSISSGKSWIGEVENRRKNGDTFYSHLQISPIFDSDKKILGYFGLHRDLTGQRNLEKQLIQTQKMESIGTLAAGVAHEVGNPLASISALAQIIQRSTKDTFIIEKLELIKKQINRISKIIRDLVDFSRPSNYELKSTDINLNLREALDIVRVGKKAKDIIFKYSLDDSLPKLPLVSDQIQQVFVNILINAVDAVIEMKEGSGSDFIGEINAYSVMKKDEVIITLSDNGKGIAEKNLNKIFEPFYTTKAVGKGTGLGLWVSYGIIKSFQGDIHVQSQENQGTSFIITLPVNPVY
ncbi:MAG: PAS domain S-box protein [Ignavibacteriaceae bacterium]|nr:PAS domain S-box protein [Ignavibacteriaceae bacterium]